MHLVTWAFVLPPESLLLPWCVLSWFIIMLEVWMTYKWSSFSQVCFHASLATSHLYSPSWWLNSELQLSRCLPRNIILELLPSNIFCKIRGRRQSIRIDSMRGFSNLWTRFTIRNTFCIMTEYTYLKETMKHFSRHWFFYFTLFYFSLFRNWLPPTEFILLLTDATCDLKIHALKDMKLTIHLNIIESKWE